MSVDLSGPFCGCLGCTEPAIGPVEHPKHGEVVVCERHAAELEDTQ